MNDSELEFELQKLRPAAPSRMLDQRIEQELTRRARHHWPGIVNLMQILRRRHVQEDRAASTTPGIVKLLQILQPRAAALGAVAVAIALVAITWRQPDPPSALAPHAVAEDLFEAGTASQVLLGVRDHGIYLRDDQAPVRMVHYRFVDTVALRNRATGAQLEVSVPRQELIAFPVAYQ